MEEKILFESIVGSKLYGTDSERSDTDIKGIFLPKMKDLILCKAPKHYILNTNKSGSNTKEDIDKTYYSLQYFLELLSKGETNAMDLLFAMTNDKCILHCDTFWKENFDAIVKNCITKNVCSYLSYCKSQAIRYSLKGDKLSNYQAFRDFLVKQTPHYLLKDVLIANRIIMDEDLWVRNDSTDYMKGTKLIGKRNKIEGTLFGDHVYVLLTENKEQYFMISDIKFQLNGTVNMNKASVFKTLKSYGQRAENAAENKGADFKALSHAVRVLFQAEELLTTGKITFPLKGEKLEKVREIKFKKTNMTYDEIVDFIEGELNYIETNFLPNSKLREKPDYKFMEEIVLKAYEM